MSEVRVYDAPSDLVGRWVREADMQALRAENARLRGCLQECVSCIEVLSMRGVDHDECGTVEAAIREGWWCNMAIDARTHKLIPDKDGPWTIGSDIADKLDRLAREGVR